MAWAWGVICVLLLGAAPAASQTRTCPASNADRGKCSKCDCTWASIEDCDAGDKDDGSCCWGCCCPMCGTAQRKSRKPYLFAGPIEDACKCQALCAAHAHCRAWTFEGQSNVSRRRRAATTNCILSGSVGYDTVSATLTLAGHESIYGEAADVCSAGRFGHSPNCVDCPAGRYSSKHSQTSCAKCSAGRFSALGAAACTACPAGKFGTLAYLFLPNTNTWPHHGSEAIDERPQVGLSVAECKSSCDDDAACDCIVVTATTTQCWRRANCVESAFVAPYPGYDVYTKDSAPSCVACGPGLVSMEGQTACVARLEPTSQPTPSPTPAPTRNPTATPTASTTSLADTLPVDNTCGRGSNNCDDPTSLCEHKGFYNTGIEYKVSRRRVHSLALLEGDIMDSCACAAACQTDAECEAWHYDGARNTRRRRATMCALFKTTAFVTVGNYWGAEREPCAAGKWRNGALCTVCPAGKYSDRAGRLAVCETCSSGRYQDQSGNASCKDCAKGMYGDLAGQDAQDDCKPCAKGTFGDLTGQDAQADCKPCAKGTFGDRTGQDAQTDCKDCLAGQYQDDTGQASCKSTACVAGKYFEATAQTAPLTCKDCAKGKFSEITGADQCAKCAKGKFNDVAGQPACKSCPKGTYQGGVGKQLESACKPCRKGTYGDLAGQTAQADCKPCAKGTFGDLAGLDAQDDCKPCAKGTFGDLAGQDAQADCKPCAKGTFGDRTGQDAQTDCKDCAKGMYGDLAGQDAQDDCKPCAKGTFGDLAGQDAQADCKPCAKGTFGDRTGQDAQTDCKDCAKGKFSEITGADQCTKCAKGKFNDVAGQPACKSCPKGTYTDNVKAVGCKPCAKGRYNDQKGQDHAGGCKDCATGMYGDQEARATAASFGTGCKPCVTGKYQESRGQTTEGSCTDCPTGLYEDTAGQASCKRCGKGMYGDQAAQVAAGACKQCDKGMYADAAGQTACKNCAVGKYNDQVGQTATNGCKDCPAGLYSDQAPAVTCAQCVEGRFQPTAGNENCNLCPVGKTTKISGSTARSECKCDAEACCGPGTYLQADPDGAAGPLKAECTNCPSGEFQESAGQLQCTLCPRGKFQATEGQTYCVSCASGRSLDAQGSRRQGDCMSCAPGRFQARVGSRACDTCPAGMHQPSSDEASCISCQPGSWSAANASRCMACAKGWFGNSGVGRGSSAHCVRCPAGKFQGRSQATFCVACGVGKAGSAARGTSAETVQCEACAPGTFQSGVGSASCTACTAGQYQDSLGQPNCKSCTPGSWCNQGARKCQQCAPGQFGVEESAQYSIAHCRACDDGQYQTKAGVTYCLPVTACAAGRFESQAPMSTADRECELCASGQFRSSPGGKSCNECPLGKFQTSEGGVACDTCAAGKMGVDANSRTSDAHCENCPEGRSQANAAQSSCDACLRGTYASSTGQVSCSDCVVGQIAAANAEKSCQQCEAGKVASARRSVSCTDCAPGQYQHDSGQSTCIECAKGTYGDEAARQVVCEPCAAGQYQENAGKTACVSCAAGKKGVGMDQSVSAYCVDCDKGTFSAKGSVSCLLCGLGQYQPLRASSSCATCSASNEYQDMAGQSFCKTCQSGSYRGSASSCIECPPGHKCDGSSKIKCAAGKYGDANGQTSCKTCVAGQYQTVAGKAACDACGAGKHGRGSDQTVASYCVDCAAGKYSGKGSTSCTDCTAGQVQPTKGAAACITCSTSDEYQDIAGQSACKACQSGSYRGSASSCIECPPGHKCDGSSKIKCAAGKYGDANGQTSCKTCVAGQYQTVAGKAACDACGAGKHGRGSDQTVASYCVECAPGRYSAKGSTSCAECAAGYHQPRPGAASCTECGADTYQSAAGQPACVTCMTCPSGLQRESCSRAFEGFCVPCAPGNFINPSGACTACAKGRYTGNASQTRCYECTEGQYQDEEGQPSCLKLATCTAGERVATAPNATHDRVCAPCQPGFFSNTSNAPACTKCSSCNSGPRDKCGGAFEGVCPACLPGSFVNVATKQCQPCPAGTYSENAGQTSCTPCEVGFWCADGRRTYCNDAGMFCPDVGLSAPRACPVGMSCDAEKTERQCAVGEKSSNGKCTRCADGSFVIDNRCQPCPRSEAVTCLEAKPVIADNYFCAACASQPVAFDSASMAAEGALLGCPIAGACQTSLNTSSMIVTTTCAAGRVGALCMACAPGYGAAGPSCMPCPPSGAVESAISVGLLIFLALFVRVVRLALRHGRRGHKGKFVTMTALKILLVFLFATSLLSSYQLDWGNALRTVFGVNGGAAAGDVSSVALTGCVGLSLHAKLRFTLAAPFAAVLLPLPALGWSRLRGSTLLCGARPSDAYYTAVLIALWMLHPMVMRECLLALITTRVGERQYVAADMSVSTDDPEYAATRAIATALLATFVPALPLYVFGTMWRHREHLRTKSAQVGAPEWLRQRYFYFYGSFKPQFYYWECWPTLMKLVLVVIASCASVEPEPSVLIFAATWVVLAVWLVEFKYEAYARKVEERLVKLTLFVLFAIFLCALGLQAGKAHAGFVQLLRVGVAMGMLGTMLVFGYIFLQQCCAKQAERHPEAFARLAELQSMAALTSSLTSFVSSSRGSPGKMSVRSQGTISPGHGRSTSRGARAAAPGQPRGMVDNPLATQVKEQGGRGSEEGATGGQGVREVRGWSMFGGEQPNEQVDFVHGNNPMRGGRPRPQQEQQQGGARAASDADLCL